MIAIVVLPLLVGYINMPLPSDCDPFLWHEASELCIGMTNRFAKEGSIYNEQMSL